MTKQTSIDIPVRLVLVEGDDGATQQRLMANHLRRIADGWHDLADTIDSFSEFLDTMPVIAGDADNTSPGAHVVDTLQDGTPA